MTSKDDDLVRRLRGLEKTSNDGEADEICADAADALKAQAAETARLKAMLESERVTALRNEAQLNNAKHRIATLEAQVEAFRRAANGVSRSPSEHREFGTVFVITEYWFDALMSALRNTETKDG
jgi:predicted site-specific integrase-resolvase